MKLKELFSDPKRWTQKEIARSKSGRSVAYDSRSAVCFCLVGGLCKCYPNSSERRAIVEKIEKGLGTGALWKWNDDPERTIEDIQKLCNELDI